MVGTNSSYKSVLHSDTIQDTEPIAGLGFYERGQLAPSPPETRFGECYKLPQWGPEQSHGRLNDSPGSLFCYVIKSKQQQKSLNIAAKGLHQPPPSRPEIT